MPTQIQLRDVMDSDFPTFLEHQHDAVAARMAAFGTRDADATELAARWRRSRAGSEAAQKAILADGELVGYVATFLLDGELHVTYWVARSHWGRGIATAALCELLRQVTVRPLHASAASDNAGSLRVLERCGFVRCGSGTAFANARSEEIEEVFLRLD